MTRLTTALLAIALALVASGALAQDEDVSVPSRAAAAEAYDRGSAFYLNEDFARAAQWFETAYRLAPAAPTLMQAVRAHLRAGHAMRAANLALRLRGLHGDDPDAARMADEVLAEHGPAFFRLDVDCADCTLEIDGRVWSYTAAMIEPSTEHTVVVQRGDARRELTVRGERGEQQVIEAPDEPERTAPLEPEPPPPSPAVPTPRGSRMPLPPWVFGVGAGLTAVSAGLLIWSGVDTLDGVDEFNAMPTWEAFYAGEEKEVRTNVLIGVTVGLGALTILFAILTDWAGEPAPDAPEVGVVVDPTMLGFTLRERF